jgi:hypothetical protein
MRWNSIHIEDKENILLIIKGIFDNNSDKAVTRISGFIKDENGRQVSVKFTEVLPQP